MTTPELVVLAFALAMDAVAVALAQGLQLRRPSLRDALLVAGMFGLFQGLMPLLGFAVAFWSADLVSSATPWIAFAMLAAIGAHMVRESFGEHAEHHAAPVVTIRSVVPLAIATSIDAAAVGGDVRGPRGRPGPRPDADRRRDPRALLGRGRGGCSRR
ncbi:manganese efflux pump [Nocardioides sp. TF02-7]|uniref:manganese efflux pump MntP n=1 Tax=Nocardioides sp. TF02-7 TaxID=2917724 RepID=UPI001F050C43|nr:manganese efflux pump [Nocardioides sp. TF02-7]UMG92775.1 manganese efflux pump [Nocardioides sp. TF02-7]